MAGSTAVRALDRPDPSALGEMVNAELSNQIATAKSYPRDEMAALAQLLKLATRSDAVAESCMYALKRNDKGKTVYITGPSVRFAELLVYVWGNMRAGARITEEGAKAVVAQGVAYDLQRNTGLMLEVRRSITTSSGGRYGQDMINVTSNAACSIALRNAIFDCIPQVLWWDVYEAVKAHAVGAAQIPERIQQAIKFFVSKGAVEADILASMGVKAIADMGRDHLEIFLGLRTALKEGAIDAAKIFTAEGAEQRRKLNMLDEDDDTGDSFNTIDKQIAPKENAAPKDGAKSLGDSGQAGESDKARTKAKPAKAAAGSEDEAAADPPQESKGDDGSNTQHAGEEAGLSEGSGPAADQTDTGEADADRIDAETLDSIEKKLDPAKAMSSRKAVNENRGALNAIVATGSPDLRARAEKILKDWPAK